MAAPRHLYVHLPFCARRCGYCAFVVHTGSNAETRRRYVDALLVEIGALGLAPASLDTVYLGGGTPTLVAARDLARLLAALPLAPGAEVTIEANPDTVDGPFAAALVAAGVTRASIGAQSFDPDVLATLDRVPVPAAFAAAVAAFRAAGVGSVSLDLLYSVPDQDVATLEASLDAAVALAPDHLSCYELEARPGAAFARRYRAELASQADALESHLDVVVARLVAAGYAWYETANFCRPGHEARHNLAIWRGADYAAAGVGAVSTVAGRRRRNRPALAPYLARPADPPHDLEAIDAPTAAFERLMLGLRLAEGVVPAPGSVDAAERDRLTRMGLVAPGDPADPDRLRLTDRGRRLANGVVAALAA